MDQPRKGSFKTKAGVSADRSPGNALGDDRGFTLVEVLIVITTVMVLVAISMPQVLTILELYRLDISTSLVEGKVADARINAIKLNRYISLAVDIDGRSLQVQYNDGGTVNLGPPAILPEGIVLLAPTPTEITFDAWGGAIAAPKTYRLEVERTGTRKDVTVSPTGKITVN